MILQTLNDGTRLWTHDKGEYISDVISQTGWYYEPKTIEYIKGLKLSNCAILDVGANIGNHTVAINKYTEDCTIYSFEPYNENFDVLKKNTKDYTNISCVNVFLDSSFNLNCTDIKISPIWGDKNLGYIKQSNVGQTINKISSIDAFVFDYSGIKLIKIDTEGNELNILKGASMMFGLFKILPIIIAEHHTEKEHLDVLEYLSQFGYKLETIIKEDNLNYVYTWDTKK